MLTQLVKTSQQCTRKPLESHGGRDITEDMMLVTLHLINAWILKALQECQIYLISHYSSQIIAL